MRKFFLTLALMAAVFSTGGMAHAQNSAAAMATTPPAAASSTAPATNSEGFTMAPAYPNTVNPRKFVFEIKPGGSAEDYAFIKNFSNETVHFSLYGADPTVSNTGSPAYLTREQTVNGPGTWIRFAEPEIDLKPGEERIVKFAVEVPSGAALGDYRAGIAMEKSKKDINNPAITIATRFIMHAEIKVTNDPRPVPRQNGQAPPPSQPAWQTYYFWVSLALFLISLGLLIWAMLHEKRARGTTGTSSSKTQARKQGRARTHEHSRGHRS